jgi:hypothetical protein
LLAAWRLSACCAGSVFAAAAMRQRKRNFFLAPNVEGEDDR